MKYDDLLETLERKTRSDEHTAHDHAKTVLGAITEAEEDDTARGALVKRLHLESVVHGRRERPGRASLVTIAQLGEDAVRYWVTDDGLTIGRDAELSFEEDEYLSPQHAKLWWHSEATLVLEDQGSRNGTFVQVLARHDLSHGDVFLMGRQVVRFVNLSREHEDRLETDDTKQLGSPQPPDGYAVQSLGIGDAVYDVRHLFGQSMLLGREPQPEEDEDVFAFGDDVFMSGSHARVLRHEGRWVLEDAGSQNGTWIRTRGRRMLEHGDHIFLGKQLFRVEFNDMASGEEE